MDSIFICNTFYCIFKSDYIISIKDTIKDTNNAPVMVQEGTVTTDSGLFSGISFTLQDIGDSYNVSGELIHTDMSCDDIYVSLASYKGNLLIGYQLEVITPTWDVWTGTANAVLFQPF